MSLYVISHLSVKFTNQREVEDVFALLQIFLLQEKSRNRKRTVRIVEEMYSVSHEVNDIESIRKETSDRLGMSRGQLRKDLCYLRKSFFAYLTCHMPEYNRYIDCVER